MGWTIPRHHKQMTSVMSTTEYDRGRSIRTMGSRFNPSVSTMHGTKVKLLGRNIDYNQEQRKLEVYNHCRYGKNESNMLHVDPAMRNVYRRLLNLKPHLNDVDQAVPRGKHDRIEVPNDDGVLYGGGHVQCQCYVDAMRKIQGMMKKDESVLLSTMSLKHIWSNYEYNEDVQFPMSTILVQWNLQVRFRPYTNCDLHNILSCYGVIAAIYKHNRKSALVVFDDIQSACRAIESKQLGYNLTCAWWNKYMLTHCMYSTTGNNTATANRLYRGTAKLNHSTTIIY